MKDWLLDHLPESFLGAFAAIVGWIAHRAVARVDALETRTADLEKKQATRDDLEDLREAMNGTLTRSLARIESRQDEILMMLAQRENR